jgi:hypothetical protein
MPDIRHRGPDHIGSIVLAGLDHVKRTKGDADEEARMGEKAVVATGASRSIGAAVAETLAADAPDQHRLLLDALPVPGPGTVLGQQGPLVLTTASADRYPFHR